MMIIVRILIFGLYIFNTNFALSNTNGCNLNFEYERTEIEERGCDIFPNNKTKYIDEGCDVSPRMNNNRYIEEDCSLGRGCNAYEEDLPLTTDSRIKTFIYNPNEVYLVLLHYGFQSSIEFHKGESVETITLGDSFAWKITPLNNRLFIKPMEKNIRTNMTVITNKRTYQFDIMSKDMEEGYEKDLVYVIRFYYPKKKTN